MAIHTEQVEDVQGFVKEIDAGAMNMILDNLQVFQYQHPQKSAIRELVSNGLDAIREKQIALSIFSGKSKVEDHFITRNDAPNKDSNFDPRYFDPKWLWKEGEAWHGWGSGDNGITRTGTNTASTVFVTYEEGGELGKDKVIIEDFGVGLGGSRLEGYFKIGYSTKRNTKEALGKYGLGAKAGLSTAPYYTMVSRYNGREYHFIVYPHKIQSIVPKVDMLREKENGIHMFSNGAVIYYKETKMPNGVKVELESKKHHKQLYIDAVKSQLLYFPNVEFRVKNQHGGLDVIPIAAKIIYEDENILLSDNNQYSKPHALISRVNLGYIDFRELELEDVQGNIAFKIPAEQVQMNPNRESLVWNEFTRNTVVSYFEKVKATAEAMVSEQLKVDDFIEWLMACAQVSNKFSTDSIIGRLSKMVDMSSARVSYVNDKSLIYGSDLFSGLKIRVNELQIIREGSVVKYKINRKEHGLIQALADGLPIYLQQRATSFKVDKYLLQGEYPRGFITVIDPFSSEEDGKTVRRKEVTSQDILDAASYIHRHLPKPDGLTPTPSEHAIATFVHDKVWTILEWMMKSKHLLRYDDIVVPETFDAKEEVEDEQAVEKVKAKAEREKMKREKGIIPIFTPRNVTSSYITPNGTLKSPPDFKLYEWQQIEMPVADIDEWDEEEVFYGNHNEQDMSLMHLAALITRPQPELTWNIYDWGTVGGEGYQKKRDLAKELVASDGLLHKTALGNHNTIFNVCRCHNFFQTAGSKPRVKLVKVAQDRVKFFLDFKPIQRFFMDIKNKKLTMSNALIRWNTARLIHAELPKLQFLRNFSRFDNKYQSWFLELQAYVNSFYRELKDHSKDSKFYSLKEDSYDDLVSHMDKVTRFQLFVRDHPAESEKIAELARDMFNPTTIIEDGLAIEMDKYDKLRELLDFAQPISTLLNEVKSLINMTTINEDLETEIRHYCESKGVKF